MQLGIQRGPRKLRAEPASPGCNAPLLRWRSLARGRSTWLVRGGRGDSRAGAESVGTSGSCRPRCDGIVNHRRCDRLTVGCGAVNHGPGPKHPIAVAAIIHLEKQRVPKKLVYRPLSTETGFRQRPCRLSVHNLNSVRPKCSMPPKTTSC
jgi:hypothetical protein